MSQSNDRDVADVYLVKKYTDSAGVERQKWIQIGVAFPHSKGMGYSLVFDIYPSQAYIDSGHNMVIRARNDQIEKTFTKYDVVLHGQWVASIPPIAHVNISPSTN